VGAQVLVQVADRLGQPGVVGGQHDLSGVRVNQALEDGDALGGPQDHIEGGHGVAAMGRPSSSPVGSRPSNKGVFISVGGRQAGRVIYETYLVA
jgi:hypothetical protein